MIYQLDDLKPEVDADVWVADSAEVIGNVRLEAGVSIWFGAVIRGDNEPVTVGEGSNIQEHAMLHCDAGYPLRIGRDCTIGHRAILHGCTIGDGALIGMGAIVLNGAKIGNGCLIGAGALITEGKEIPDGSLVMGAPGKVVRMLDAATHAGLLASAAHYRANAARFRHGLTRL